MGRLAIAPARTGRSKKEATSIRAPNACYTRHHRVTAPTPLVQRLQIGALTVHAIQAGGQKLDGGAMFGVVPKPLWQKRIPADDRNRIQLGMGPARIAMLRYDIPDIRILYDSDVRFLYQISR